MSPSRQKEQSLELSAVAGFPARVRNDRLLFKGKDDERARARALFPGFPTRVQKHRLSLFKEKDDEPSWPRQSRTSASVSRQGRPPAPPGSRASPARVAEALFRRLVLRVVWAGPCQLGCPPIEPSAARNPSGRPAKLVLRVRRLICPACSRVCGACQARFASVRVVWSPSSLGRPPSPPGPSSFPERRSTVARRPCQLGSLAGPARVTRQALLACPARIQKDRLLFKEKDDERASAKEARFASRARRPLSPPGLPGRPRQGPAPCPPGSAAKLFLRVPVLGVRCRPSAPGGPRAPPGWPAKLVLRVSQCYGRSSNVSTARQGGEK